MQPCLQKQCGFRPAKIVIVTNSFMRPIVARKWRCESNMGSNRQSSTFFLLEEKLNFSELHITCLDGVFDCSPVLWRIVRCEWKHWPNQPEPVSPTSVDLHISGYSLVHLKPCVSWCSNRSVHTYDPHMCTVGSRAALVHSTWSVTATSVTSSFLQKKGSAYVLFFWPTFLCSAGLYSASTDLMSGIWNRSIKKGWNKFAL